MEFNDNIKIEIKELDKEIDKPSIEEKEIVVKNNDTKDTVNKDIVNKDTVTKDNKPKLFINSPDKNLKKIQKNTNRCMSCNKKIGLLGFQCKCEYYFCSEHRYSDRHECAFDYKSHGKELLIKANPNIVAKKIDII